MSRYRRSHLQGGTWFFTLNTFRKQPLLTEPAVRAALRQALTDVRGHLPFTIHAWVLLPDHLHCIWELPQGDARFGLRWGMVKRQVTRACGPELASRLPAASASRRLRHEGTLWQRRFWEHQIRDERDMERHVDYIHWNPVKHGHAQRAADWPYSTFHRYVREGIYANDWCSMAHQEEHDFGE